MTYKFDENKSKAIYDQMFGKGSFDSGMQQARDVGRTTVEAQVAKRDYTARLRAAQAAAKKKTYQDALTYWNGNKDALTSKGAYRTEQEYLNDPTKRQQIKDSGFKQQDFIDAMYATETNGNSRSKREYNQQHPKGAYNNNLQPYDPAKSFKSNEFQITPMKGTNINKAQQKPITSSHPLSKIAKTTPKNTKDERTGLLGFLDSTLGRIGNTANEIAFGKNFNDTQNANYRKLANDKLKKNPNDKHSLQALQMTNTATRPAKNKIEKVSDFLGGTAGVMAPYTVGGAYGAADTLLGKVGLNAIKKPLVKDLVRGLGAGAVAGTERGLMKKAASNEKVSPKDIAIESALAGGGDALFGAGARGLSKLMKKGAKPTAHIPSKQEPLVLPAPQLRLNSPQLQLSAPKELKPFEALMNAGKKPVSAESPIPGMPNVMRNTIKQNEFKKAGLGFGYNTKLEPKARGLLPKLKVSSGDSALLAQKGDNILNNISKMQEAPTGHYERRLLQVQQEMKNINDRRGIYRQPLSVDELYHQVKKSNDPETFDKLVKLNELEVNFNKDNPIQGPKEATLKDRLNSDPRIKEQIKGFFPPVRPEPKVSRPATLQEMFQNLSDIAPPSKPTVDPTPLQFRVPKGFNPNTPTNILNRTPGLEALMKPKPVGDPVPPLQGLKNLRLPVKAQENNPLPKLSELPLNGLKERGHINTLKQSPNSLEGLRERLNGTYKPISNNETVNLANKQIDKGLEQAVSFVKSARVLKPEHVATAHRLIQEFQKNGQISQAVDIAEHIAEQGTKAGQAVQAYSIFDKLSPEGILVHASRVADRVNAKLGVAQEKVTINADTANQLTDLATTVQKMTKQKTVANDVINIMDKAKAGEKLSVEETKSIRQFVDDAKQFVSDIQPKSTKPKAPNKIISPEVKTHVINFLDKQEEAARQRLAARKGRALSGLPVDDFYDYAVIGASKLAKGTVHLADFSEQMIMEFGQEVAPHIQQIYDKASEMVNNEVKRTTNRLSEVEKLTNKALKNGKLEVNDAENLRKFAVSIGNMSGDAKIEASQELQATLQALERPSLLQKVSAAQTIAQLLNPKTLGRNAIGNELFYRLERINKLVATPIDWTRSKLTGGERTVTFKTNNQGEYWKNWLKGAKAGLKGVNPEGLSTQYDLHPDSFNNKWNPLTYLQKGLGASLKSFDYAGYKRAVNNTIGELATLRAMNEGLTGQVRKQAIERYIREAGENVLMIADQYGKYATFQDNNILSVGLQKFKRGLNFGKEFGMGDLIIKYPKTPGALLARSLEYSPAGFLKSAYQIAKPIYEGNKVGWNHVTEAFTRALIGSAGVSGIAWFLADKGILTGTGSKDLDVANLEKQAGKAQYSLNTDALTRWVTSGFNSQAAETQKGDHFVTYNWAQPIATGISIGANVNQNVKQTGNFNLGQAAYGALGGTVDTMVEQSVLQGVKKAFTSYPGQTTGDKITDIAGDLPASFVPTLSNQVRQLTDNTTRNTYDPSKLQTFINRAKNKVPGVASSLPPAFSTLGNKQEVYKDKSNTLFNVLLNPAFVSRYNPSPEAKMVLDIINATGDNTVAPRGAQKYLIIDGKRHDLTTQQYSEYQRRLGQEVNFNLLRLLPYANDPDKEKLGKEVNKILDKAGRKVRTELKQEFR